MTRTRVMIAVVAAGLSIATAPGPRSVRAADKAAVEPRAGEILKAALTHLAAAPGFTCRAEVTNERPLPAAPKLQFAGTLEVAVRRPDRLWYKLEGEQRNATAWYDGKVFTLLDREKKACAYWQAQEPLGRLFEKMREKLGFTPPLALLMHENPHEEALKKVSSGFYVGQGLVRGVLSHHLAFRQENVDWQIWIAAEGDPLIKRLVFTNRKDPAAPQSTATFLDWDLMPRLADSTFTYTPQEGVIRCEFQRSAE